MLLTVLVAALAPLRGDHSATLVLEVADALGGCGVGDVDPARGGNEIVVTSSKGPVFVVQRAEAGWQHEVAFHAPGEMIQVAVGDALPAHPGDEIVAVGMREGPEGDGPGAVHVIWREGSAWKSTLAFEGEALIHGVAVGEGDVWVAGYDRAVHLLRAKSGGFEHVASAALPGNGKNALAVPGGVVVACTDGSLVQAKLEGPALAVTVLDRRESGRARLGTDGTRLVVADDDGTLSLVSGSRRETIHTETGKLRGAVLADLDPDAPGIEAATTGYSGRVTLLRERDGRFVASLLFADRAGFHHAVAGDVDGVPGPELVVCGLAGRVLVFHFGAQR
jgi:hypothetical protein